MLHYITGTYSTVQEYSNNGFLNNLKQINAQLQRTNHNMSIAPIRGSLFDQELHAQTYTPVATHSQ